MKKHISYLLMFLCAFILFTVGISAKPFRGDTNSDGAFTLVDAINAINAIDIDTFTDEEFYVYDVDRSGAITLKDVLEIAKRVINKRAAPYYCDINNLYHDNCIWEHLTIGSDNTLTFTSQAYSNIKMRFKLYIPRTYSPHKSYALVTHLHGLGGENQATANLSGSTFFSNIRKSEYGEDTIYLLPQCPVGMTWPDDRDTIRVAYRLIMDLCQHLSIDESRLYISGHSNGSKGVAYMLMEYPNTFAAAVMGSGASGLSYYTNLENIATTPIWMFIGTADEIPGFYKNVNDLYEALMQMGADVKYTEYKGLKHNIFSTVGNEEGLVDWVYARTLTK